jgi:hypothetical protein
MGTPVAGVAPVTANATPPPGTRVAARPEGTPARLVEPTDAAAAVHQIVPHSEIDDDYFFTISASGVTLYDRGVRRTQCSRRLFVVG